MAYNSSGNDYGYQRPADQRWQQNYAHQGQVNAQAQMQYQRQTSGQYQPNPQATYAAATQQIYSNMRASQSPQIQQYQTTQSPINHAPGGFPPYAGRSSPFDAHRQQMQSPQSQHHSSPQQPYAGTAYSRPYNQQSTFIPQRQLSYSQVPSSFQQHSQSNHGSVLASPQMPTQQHRVNAPIASPNMSHLPPHHQSYQAPVRSHQSSSTQQINNFRQAPSPIMHQQVNNPISQTPLPRRISGPSSSPSPGLSVAVHPQLKSTGYQQRPTSSDPPSISHHGQDALRYPNAGKVSASNTAQREPPRTASPLQTRDHNQQVKQAQPYQLASVQPDTKRQKFVHNSDSLASSLQEQPKSRPSPPGALQRLTEHTAARIVPTPPLKPQQAPTQAPTPPQIQDELPAIEFEPDYALLLIDLAEEYFEAAYGKHTNGRQAKREPDLNVFYKLISTGLACLEIVLKKWRSALQPAVEAAVRLRYASILHEETDNTSQAEEVLSKGISQCDKLRLHDFKYNMQHLLARITFQINSKAAGRYLDNVIKDAEVQNHYPWVYAFRFLRASLSLATQQNQETFHALSQLKILCNRAKERGDIAVVAATSALEAITHISRATSSDAIEHAQSALTAIRTWENNPTSSKIPQVSIMAHFVDLICSLFRSDFDLSQSKMKSMETTMDSLLDHANWSDDSYFLVPISQESAKSMPNITTHGAVVSHHSERTYIKLSWLPKNELFAIGNMLCASTVMSKASQEDRCLHYLDNADRYLTQAEKDANNPVGQLQEDLRCHLQVLKVFASCVRSAWAEAKQELNNLKDKLANMNDTAKASLQVIVIYLQGMIAQGTGNTATALALYSNPMLALENIDSTTNQRNPIVKDLAILAAANTMLIVHQPDHPQHHLMEKLLSMLEDIGKNHPTGNITAAYFLTCSLHADASSDPTSSKILLTKSYLSQVLQLSKRTKNDQFSYIGLTFMADRFFKGLTGEQAIKSPFTALKLARREKNELWTSVACGLYAACLETNGEVAEAEMKRREALQLAAKLPTAMQVVAASADVPME